MFDIFNPFRDCNRNIVTHWKEKKYVFFQGWRGSYHQCFLNTSKPVLPDKGIITLHWPSFSLTQTLLPHHYLQFAASLSASSLERYQCACDKGFQSVLPLKMQKGSPEPLTLDVISQTWTALGETVREQKRKTGKKTLHQNRKQTELLLLSAPWKAWTLYPNGMLKASWKTPLFL